MAICKPQHWGLGIGNRIVIVTGTDITNGIISIFIRLTDPEGSKLVTLDGGSPPTKSCEMSISLLRTNKKRFISTLVRPTACKLMT